MRGKREYVLNSRKVAAAAVFTAVGLAISPLSFEWLGTRAFPGQHLVNVLSGTLLGPLWAVAVSIAVGTIRLAMGTGTVFAYPGGIPGAIAVSLAFFLTSKFTRPSMRYLASFAEPLGTVLVGGTLSLLVVAPLLGPGVGPSAALLRSLENFGPYTALLILWGGWFTSSIIGSILGYFLLVAAHKYGVLGRMYTSARAGSRR
ncbi:hypothetical protein HRbin01_00396 [archaeon HR01]|nr:hypothetical protein HRbin01_00396 [archaeon HR01]